MDQLAEKVNFNLKKEYRTGTWDDPVINQNVIECKLLGIRQQWTNPQLPRPEYNFITNLTPIQETVWTTDHTNQTRPHSISQNIIPIWITCKHYSYEEK